MMYSSPICVGSNNDSFEHRTVMTPKHMTPDVNYYASKSSAVNIMFQCEKCFRFKLVRYMIEA